MMTKNLFATIKVRPANRTKVAKGAGSLNISQSNRSNKINRVVSWNADN